MESDNKLLADDMAWARQHNIDYHPTITINNFTYRGDIDFVDVREAICAAYQERPGGCTLDEIWNAEPSQNPNHNRRFFKLVRTIRAWHVVAAIAVVILVQCCLWAYMQRRTRREADIEVNSRVQAAVHEYFALSVHD